MRQAIPPITDHADGLKHRLPREHDGHRKPRLPMRYLLASGPVQTRQDVAHLLGVHRSRCSVYGAVATTPGAGWQSPLRRGSTRDAPVQSGPSGCRAAADRDSRPETRQPCR
jgi:hypothetical protein